MGKALIVAFLFVAACNRQAPPEAKPTNRTPSPEEVAIEVRLTTTSGLIGTNQDDKSCFWHQPSYVLKDDSGKIIATGEVPAGGTIGGEPASIGVVASQRPNYRCDLEFAVKADTLSDFYQLEVTTGSYRGEATFAHADITAEPVVIEVTR